MLVQLHEKYPQDVRLVFRHFPLNSIHPKARLAAMAAEAAGKQDRFFEMKTLLFEKQAEWTGLDDAGFREWLVQAAEDLKLEPQTFSADLASAAIAKKVDDAYQKAIDSGLSGTPFLVVNGLPYSGPRDFQNFEIILKGYRLSDKQYTQCPPMRIKVEKQYFATIETSQGNIVIELYPDKAPVAVNSFIFLSQEGWFNDNIFYLVIPGFVALTGDPSGTGYGSPGFYYDKEISDLRFDKAGVVGMDNSGPNSSGSRFFITYSAQPKLDGSFTIFGQVVEGMDVLDKLATRNPNEDSVAGEADKIIKISVEEE